LVIATHLDNDNLSSMNAVVERYDVGQVVEPTAPSRPGVSYQKWRDLNGQKQIKTTQGEQGTSLHVAEMLIDLLYPHVDTTPSVLALRLQTNGKTFLLAPGLRKADRQEIMNSDGLFDADVAVLPNEVEKEWVEKVMPESVVMFVGRRPSDQPTAETLRLLEGTTVLRTDANGIITYILDGEQAKVETQK